jgi:hypothetical protein
VFQTLNFDPDIISSAPHALMRFSQEFFNDHPSTALFHLGQERSCAIVLDNGKMVLAHTASYGTTSPNAPFEKDLERLCAYIKKRCPSIQSMIITGNTQEAPDFFQPLLSRHFTVIDSQEPYAVPIGLCLDALKQDGKSLQLRTAAFAPAKAAAKETKAIKRYLFCTAASFLLLFCAGSFCLHKKERLSLETHVAAPKAGDLLAWLSLQDKIALSSLRYQLLEDAAYVELEFSAPSPELAQEFHETLLKGGPFIDTTKEISWQAAQERYRSSFYLGGS